MKQESVPGSRPVLRLQDVRFSYGRASCLLDGVDLDVYAGRVHCLLGPSGCGKTTLLRIVAGLESADGGEITINGKRVNDRGTHVPTERRSVGFMFQDHALFPHLTVRANVTFGMTGQRRRRHRIEEAERLLASVGLEGLSRRMPHTLSGGQQQRVALVRAMARRPQVMLLDEPFTSLDEGLRHDVRDTTLGALRAAGVGVLMVTHDADEARSVADEISVLDRGRVASRTQRQAPAGTQPGSPLNHRGQ